VGDGLALRGLFAAAKPIGAAANVPATAPRLRTNLRREVIKDGGMITGAWDRRQSIFTQIPADKLGTFIYNSDVMAQMCRARNDANPS
jgi:hypothetical protein